MHLEEKKIDSQTLFQGRIITVCRDNVLLENGETATREMVLHPGGVCVIPYCEEDDTILMVKQFRYPFQKPLLELPAGKLEWGEKHYDCGLRELREETGATPKSYEYLGAIYPTPAYVSEIIHLYLAKGLEFGDRNLDKDEFLDVIKMPLDKAAQMVLQGEICDSKTQIGILKAKLLLG